MAIIESIKDYMITCPLLKDGYFRVDFLGNKPTQYVIESLPTDPVIQEYVDGSSERQYLFAVGSREYFGMDTLQNINNLSFYEDLADWIEEQSDLGNLPILGDGIESMELEIVSTGYLFSTDGKTARYQIQFRLKYFKEAK